MHRSKYSINIYIKNYSNANFIKNNFVTCALYISKQIYTRASALKNIYNTHEKNTFYKRYTYNQIENDKYHYEIIDSSAWRYPLLETTQNLESCHQKNPLFVVLLLAGCSLLESGMAIPKHAK